MTMTYYDKLNKATIKGNSYTAIQKFGVGKIKKIKIIILLMIII